MTPRSLSARLSLGIVLLVLLSIGLMAGLAVWRSAAALRERALASNLTVALGVSRAVQQYLTDALAIMREAGERPKLRHEITQQNWPEAQTVLDSIVRNFRQFEYVFVQDPHGIVRLRVPPADIVGQDFSSREAFRGVMQTRRPFLSGVYVSQSAHRPVAAIAVPVLDGDGQISAVLVGALSLEAMGHLVSTAAHEDGRAIAVIDRQGRLVADSRAAATSLVDVRQEPVVEAALAGDAGSRAFRAMRGSEEILAAHAPITPFGWGVVVTWPATVARAPAVRLGAVLLWIAVGCIATAIGVGVGFARRLTRPLAELGEASAKIAAGELATRVAVRGPAEVRALARAFNRMVTAVAESRVAVARRATEAEGMNRQLAEEAEERRRAEASARRQAERLAVLHEIDRAILSAQSPAEIADTALRQLRRFVDAPRAVLALYDIAAGQGTWLAVDAEHRTDLRAGAHFPLEMMGDLGALRRGEVQIMDVPSLSHVPQARAVSAEGVQSYAVVPLIAHGELIGSLNVGAREPGGPSPEDVSVAGEIANQLAIALKQSRLFEELRASYYELQQTQAQLTQAQKMEAIGRLAGGVAHDFNNLLTVISGRSHLTLQHLAADHPLRKNVELILTTAERAAALTRQLLAFSRKQILEPKVLDLNAVVTGLTPMLRRLIGEDIELVAVPAPDLRPVKADPSQLEQVLLNLAVNARDAMPQGGQLTIETANTALDEAYTRSHPGATPGDFVMLAVSDTGHGMDAATQARIFDPFFTTKEPGKGTGLGLATVYGIVKQSSGRVWVYSEPGQGATFKIYLPRVEEVVDRPAPQVPAQAPARGSETLLLVEDDDEVRALARETLEAGGYVVIPAASAAEALRLAGDGSRPIDLLVTDVVLPQLLSGRGLAERLTADQVVHRVLYMSGYTDDAILRHGVLEEGAAFLQKPFTPDALLRKVREVLDQPASRASGQ